ncbi:rhamnosyltransferase [Burkholderia pseudomallei]|nr:rhamnosyltransferase [Burkholderia pseudomallei]
MQLGLQYGLRFPVALVPNLLTIWQVVQVVLCEREKGAKLAGSRWACSTGCSGAWGRSRRRARATARHARRRCAKRGSSRETRRADPSVSTTR